MSQITELEYEYIHNVGTYEDDDDDNNKVNVLYYFRVLNHTYF